MIESMTTREAGLDPPAWDRLHAQPRFRPRYPSEAVVRFIARYRFQSDNTAGVAAVLDMGCGAGRHLELIERTGYRCVGVDYSIEGLRHAAETLCDVGYAPRLTQAQMQALPFSSRTFESAVSYGVLYYNDAAGYRAAVQELWRVLKGGGRLLVVTRTTRDYRYGRGRQVGPDTFVAEDDGTNEIGMVMHFLTREAIDVVFGGFTTYTVDWQDYTSTGGTVLNSDWVIEAVK